MAHLPPEPDPVAGRPGPSHVPISMGSARARTMESASCQVTEAWFPPGACLPPHTHDRASLATMLSGSFELVSGPRRSSCLPDQSWTEPPLSKHANYIGPQGARVVVVQPSLSADIPRSIDHLFTEPRSLRRGLVSGDARRISDELRAGDALSSLSIDALVAGMLVAAARLRVRLARGSAPPAWLVRAEELVRAHFREPIALGQIAATIGVDRSALAHGFRRYFRQTMGDYLRGLRLDWALERLASSQDSIAEIAIAAGFADQSHLTRVCTRRLGISPGALRRLSHGEVRTLRNRLSPL